MVTKEIITGRGINAFFMRDLRSGLYTIAKMIKRSVERMSCSKVITNKRQERRRKVIMILDFVSTYDALFWIEGVNSCECVVDKLFQKGRMTI